MKYQLILQWPATSIKDYDQLIEIEEELIENLSEQNEVDGHDVGSGEANVFIQTNDPVSTFEEIKKILSDGSFWFNVRAAYRETAKSEYIVLWPRGLSEFSVN